MAPFSVESSTATWRVRYAYPDPAESLWIVIVTTRIAAGPTRVARDGRVGWKRCVMQRREQEDEEGSDEAIPLAEEEKSC
ncbi:hypothetical protein NKG05_25970 [Oerskovia sp. M15]